MKFKMNSREKLIEEMFKKGILVNENMLNKLDSRLNQGVVGLDKNLFEKIEAEGDLVVLNPDYTEVIQQQSFLVDWYEVDRCKVEAEKDRDDVLYQSQLQEFKNSNLKLDLPSLKSEQKEQEIKCIETEVNQNGKGKVSFDSVYDHEQGQSSVEILIYFKNEPQKHKLEGFTRLFVSRYKFLESLLRNRPELTHTLNISRILEKKEKENVSLIGMVKERGETKTGHIIITLEDLTGEIKVLISRTKNKIFQEGRDLVVDEVIGINGTSSDKIVFAEKIVWPDVPNNSLKKSENEEYVIFLSDIHVGSNLFLQEEFEKFLKWLRGETGNESQRAIAHKVKYIFIAGDVVDGVGIYPFQEKELKIIDLKEQFDEFSRLISKIPLDKQIIICPGNHDGVHLAEPQPAFYRKYAEELFKLPNVKLVTNPCLINIGKTKSFYGFNVLMYHGYSFDYYITHVASIRAGGGYHRSDMIMKFLLKRRHLAPSFKSTPYYPSHLEDPLLIKKIPDFFLTGHIHYTCVANYKGITMISGSCWQDKTAFQDKLGHEPEPGRVPIVNLKTREVKVLRFR